MSGLSNRQWRALAQAYPFYLADDAGTEDTAGDRTLDRHAGPTQSESAASSISSVAEFVQCVVPRVAKVFPEELQAYERGGEGGGAQAHPNGNDLGPASPCSVAEAVDALLVYLFGCATSALSKWPLTKQRRTFASACFAPLIAPLSCSEQQLLGLYHRKQEQYTYVLRAQQYLLAASQLAVQTLQDVSGPILADAPRGRGVSQQGVREALTLSNCAHSLFTAAPQTASWPPPPAHAAASDNGTSACAADFAPPARAPGAGRTNGCSTIPLFTRVLSSAPNASHPPEVLAAAALPVGDSGAISASPRYRTSAAPSLIVTNRCAGCQDAGGDLLLCTQCGEVRHEACGGPHPPQPHRVDGRTATVNMCKRCAKELNLSSSSSSLRSTTSSSERAELDEYFGFDDDASSLSGFIVNSSDEEEEDGLSADDDGGIDVSSAGDNGKGERRRSKGAPPPRRKGKGAVDERMRRPATTAMGVAPEVPLGSSASPTSSASSGSSSQLWSRSASLDRALTGAATRKREKRGSSKKVITRSDDEGSAGAAAPRHEGRGERQRKRRRGGIEDAEKKNSQRPRKRSGGDASAASSLVPSTPSTSSSLPTKEAFSQQQTSTRVPSSLQRQVQARRVPTPAGMKSTAHLPLDCCGADALLTQPRRTMMLEYEEELGTLGIASPSASVAPKVSPPSFSQQCQGGSANRSAGRKGAMNVASSSSSSDDSD
ncbi:hypothetical protein LSCM1_04214 [Leishmania martiniquensis]|uniref:Uncharacterized protein n=1 Tax=Leishmania martiniquensis TaxID=1580590 RepID=A0A836G770_9TRYP|nr:hypothetical protein LSCM1_04214 [Leishmania martiniquensis]